MGVGDDNEAFSELRTSVSYPEDIRDYHETYEQASWIHVYSNMTDQSDVLVVLKPSITPDLIFIPGLAYIFYTKITSTISVFSMIGK